MRKIKSFLSVQTVSSRRFKSSTKTTNFLVKIILQILVKTMTLYSSCIKKQKRPDLIVCQLFVPTIETGLLYMYACMCFNFSQPLTQVDLSPPSMSFLSFTFLFPHLSITVSATLILSYFPLFSSPILFTMPVFSLFTHDISLLYVIPTIFFSSSVTRHLPHALSQLVFLISLPTHLCPSFTEPDCGRKQKLAEIHQALIRLK